MLVTLRPFNSRFKRLIHDHGNAWVATCAPRSMPCFNGEIGITAHPVNDPRKLSNFRLRDIQ